MIYCNVYWGNLWLRIYLNKGTKLSNNYTHILELIKTSIKFVISARESRERCGNGFLVYNNNMIMLGYFQIQKEALVFYPRV